MSGVNEEAMRLAAASVTQFVIAGAAQLAENLVLANNQGAESAPPAPIRTGNLRGSLRVSVNTPSAEAGIARPVMGGSYPLTSPVAARKAIQLGGFNVGDTLWFRWIAPYANIINLGRGVDKNGRPIGSEQAPDGWVEPDRDAAIRAMATWRFRP